MSKESTRIDEIMSKVFVVRNKRSGSGNLSKYRLCDCGHYDTSYATQVSGKVICRECNQKELSK